MFVKFLPNLNSNNNDDDDNNNNNNNNNNNKGKHVTSGCLLLHLLFGCTHFALRKIKIKLDLHIFSRIGIRTGQKCVQDPCKNLQWNFSQKLFSNVNLNPLTILDKRSILHA